MKQILLFTHMLIFLCALSHAQTPLSMNGNLSVSGRSLVNECGNAVQLRGLSTHGVMFHQECYRESSIKAIAEEYKADLLRLAIYTTNSDGSTRGYVQAEDKAFYHEWIDEMVKLTEKYGLYVIIDWHILKDGNPMTYQTQAKEFFTLMAQKYKDKKHVIYEICNEPNYANADGSWANVKTYAQDIIPAIRQHDPNAVILVGTPEWSSRIDIAQNDPLPASISSNVMYTLHFYAGSGSHDAYKTRLTNAVAANFPVFVSEWGTTEASGSGSINAGNSSDWMRIMAENKISWANWQFSDKDESSSLLAPGSCLTEQWTNFKNGSSLIYDELRKAKNYTACGSVTLPSTDEGPVCSGASGDLNIYGCPITNDFRTNFCMGYNNEQAYVRNDFEMDSVPYFDYWKKPSEASSVYSSVIENGKLVITSVNADPNYSTMGFDFGKLDATNHIPVDLQANAKLQFDVSFQATSYSAQNVVLFVGLVDANENMINADALGVYTRFFLPVDGTTHTIVADFTDGIHRESVTGGTASSPEEDIFTRGVFDFSKVTKVILWVNPGVTGVFSRPAYTGTWTIDNFNLGYDASVAQTCEEYVDVDLCPDDPNKTKPGNCGCNVPEDACDCAGVENGSAYYDLCGTCVGGTTGEVECDGNAYQGTPQQIPGIVQVEFFDEGGQGAAYNDASTANDGGSTLRTGEAVDVENTPNTTGEYNIGYTAVGEWLNYTTNVIYTGTYNISFRVASARSTGSWHLEVNGQTLEGTQLSCPATHASDWHVYQLITTAAPVHLDKGKQVIKLVVDGADFNIDYIEFEAVNVVTSVPVKAATTVSVYPVPAKGMVNIRQDNLGYDKAELMNLTGNVLRTQILSSETEELSLENVPQGIYLIQLSGQAGSEYVRIVVQ